MSGFVGALTEAWSELRHHKLRVLLSLVGIAVSVGALAAVVALGDYQRQISVEQSDRFGGREATIKVDAFPTEGAAADPAATAAQVAQVAERFAFSHATRVVEQVMVDVQTADWARPVQTRLVDPAYATIHRSPLAEGRWFRAGDEELLAPPIVISTPLWESFGSPPLAGHPTIALTGDLAGTYQVIGVTPRQGQWDSEKRMEMLFDTYAARIHPFPPGLQISYEAWVPTEHVSEVGATLAMDLRASLGSDVEVNVARVDWASRPDNENSALIFELITGSIAGLVLLLGGLGLVNIQLVAMRQRIREIGVRRSFGATAGRVFTSVLLENVVATAVAGIIGIAIAVAILRAPFVLEMFSGMQDVPPFPLRAAFIGLAAAVAIGALAGFLPALVAVRVRVIEALRF